MEMGSAAVLPFAFWEQLCVYCTAGSNFLPQSQEFQQRYTLLKVYDLPAVYNVSLELTGKIDHWTWQGRVVCEIGRRRCLGALHFVLSRSFQPSKKINSVSCRSNPPNVRSSRNLEEPICCVSSSEHIVSGPPFCRSRDLWSCQILALSSSLLIRCCLLELLSPVFASDSIFLRIAA